MFALLNSGATENRCLDRGFNFTDFTFPQLFISSLSCAISELMLGVQAGAPSAGAAGQEGYTATEKSASFWI